MRKRRKQEKHDELTTLGPKEFRKNINFLHNVQQGADKKNNCRKLIFGSR